MHLKLDENYYTITQSIPQLHRSPEKIHLSLLTTSGESVPSRFRRRANPLLSIILCAWYLLLGEALVASLMVQWIMHPPASAGDTSVQSVAQENSTNHGAPSHWASVLQLLKPAETLEAVRLMREATQEKPVIKSSPAHHNREYPAAKTWCCQK